MKLVCLYLFYWYENGYSENKKPAQGQITQLTELEFRLRSLHSKTRVPPSQDKAEVDRLMVHQVYQFAEDYVSEYWSRQTFRLSFLIALLCVYKG